MDGQEMVLKQYQAICEILTKDIKFVVGGATSQVPESGKVSYAGDNLSIYVQDESAIEWIIENFAKKIEDETSILVSHVHYRGKILNLKMFMDIGLGISHFNVFMRDFAKLDTRINKRFPVPVLTEYSYFAEILKDKADGAQYGDGFYYVWHNYDLDADKAVEFLVDRGYWKYVDYLSKNTEDMLEKDVLKQLNESYNNMKAFC